MDADCPKRRNFFLVILYGLWGLMGAVLSIPCFTYLLVPPKRRREEEWTDAGDVSALTPGAPVEMVFRRNVVDGWRIVSEKTTAWAVKLDNGNVVAFAPQCTHLGCAYHWEEDKKSFLCPCHTTIFALDGSVVSGPAPRPLDRFETKVEGAKLLLGKVHRSSEEA